MALFGRRANQQSTKPEVPPELRPYYDGASRGARLRHGLGRLAPLLIAIILSGAIIGGAVWWRGKHQKASFPGETTRRTSQPEHSRNKPSTASRQPTLTPPPPTPH